jgi:tetratricopeptide (TPR) repeat protein
MPKSAKKARKSWFTGKNKKIATVGAVIVVLILALGAGLLVRMLQNGGKPTDNSGTQVNKANNDRDVLPSTVTSAQDLIGTGKNKEAGEQIASDIASTSNTDEKYELYLTQGVNFENQKQYDNALAAYKNAEAIKKTSTVYEALGRVSAAKGDKAGAINYYNQAIPLLDQSDPRHNAEKAEIEQTVKGLGS